MCSRFVRHAYGGGSGPEYGGEAVFAPREGGSLAEDDGYLVLFTHAEAPAGERAEAGRPWRDGTATRERRVTLWRV